VKTIFLSFSIDTLVATEREGSPISLGSVISPAVFRAWMRTERVLLSKIPTPPRSKRLDVWSGKDDLNAAGRTDAETPLLAAAPTRRRIGVVLYPLVVVAGGVQEEM